MRCVTSTYSKTCVFVRPHDNDKHAFFKETPLWVPFSTSCVPDAMHENAVDVWTEGLNAGKNSIFKNTSICVDGASTEAKI